MDSTSHPYDTLTPDVVLDAVEACGLVPDGRLLALNSYENRVYQVGIEEAAPVIVKFYRPERWPDAAIEEEHAFSRGLEEREIPVVAPLTDDQGRSLHRHAGFRFALFPRRGGHWPELEDPDVMLRLGRFLGRFHAYGAVEPFRHRPTLDVERFGVESRDFLLDRDFLPPHYVGEYRSLVDAILDRVREAFARIDAPVLRLHGDCHPGNILWTDRGGHFVDLDDCRMGPAIQDVWMLLSGERAQMVALLLEFIEGYEEFFDFNRRELGLIEPLRALRQIHYAAWLARRWEDPAFPQAFPWFNSEKYWEEHILTLREQAARLAEPPLSLVPA